MGLRKKVLFDVCVVCTVQDKKQFDGVTSIERCYIPYGVLVIIQ